MDTKRVSIRVPLRFSKDSDQRRAPRDRFRSQSGRLITQRVLECGPKRFCGFHRLWYTHAVGFEPSQGGDMVCIRGPLGALLIVLVNIYR